MHAIHLSANVVKKDNVFLIYSEFKNISGVYPVRKINPKHKTKCHSSDFILRRANYYLELFKSRVSAVVSAAVAINYFKIFTHELIQFKGYIQQHCIGKVLLEKRKGAYIGSSAAEVRLYQCLFQRNKY